MRGRTHAYVVLEGARRLGGRIEERVKGLIQPVIEAQGLELFDVEYKSGPSGAVLRVTIDRPEGDDHVSSDDCVAVDRLVTPILDVEDVITSSFRLEVSSPGIDRPLRGARDFRRFVGKRAKVHVERPRETGGPPLVDVLSGLIEEPDDVGVTLVPDRGAPVRVTYERLRKAHLEFRFEDLRDAQKNAQ